jgi:23S rRNA pseudouridine2605 synthase/23S rRNA pseudouridine2604 synthase
MMALMRLHKYLSSAGFCSRRKAEEFIQAGRVKVNGKVVSELGTKVDADRDVVEVNGATVQPVQKMVYIALHKPRDVVSSCRQTGARIVTDLVDVPQRVYPVGRLDKDSSGLLLLTNDGHLHHRLLHPSFDHEKEYEVTVSEPMAEGALRRLASGLSIMGSKTRPADVQRISAKRFRMTLKEGKNRQIRRMVRKVGNRVVALKRLRIASVKLGGLPEGHWRFLSPSEVDRLRNTQRQ